MALHYIEELLKTLPRTRRSMGFVSRRHLRRDARMEKEWLEKEKPELEAAMGRGDTDVVKKILGTLLKEYEHILVDMPRDEEYMSIVQRIALKKFYSLIVWFNKLAADLERMERDAREPELKRKAHELRKTVFEEKNKLTALLRNEEVVLKDEYNAVLRQYKNERGFLQNLVLSGVKGVEMELHQKLFHIGGESRDVSHDEKDLANDLKRYDVLVRQLDKKPSEQPSISEKMLREDGEKLARDLRELTKETIELLNDCKFIVKAMVREWFAYKEQFNPEIEKVFQSLKDSGYPVKDLETLKTKRAKALAAIHAKTQDAEDVFRRAARLTVGEQRRAA